MGELLIFDCDGVLVAERLGRRFARGTPGGTASAFDSFGRAGVSCIVAQSAGVRSPTDSKPQRSTLAAEAELHTVSVSRIEAGKQNLTWIALVSLATAIDVDVVELVKLAGEQPRS